MMDEDVVILNSTVLPFPSSGGYSVLVSPSTLAEVRQAVANGAVSFIGHEGTAKSLGVPFNRGMVRTYRRAYVVRLKKRLAEGEVLQSVSEADVEVLRLDMVEDWLKIRRH